MNRVFFDPYVGVRGKYSAEEIISSIAGGGYSGFNLPNDPTFFDLSGALDINNIKELTNKYNLQIHSYIPWGPSLTDSRTSQKDIFNHYEKAIDTCMQLNIPSISVWPFYSEHNAGERKHQVLRTLRWNLSMIMDLCKQRNLDLLLEFEPNVTPLENVNDAIEMAQQVPNIKISCDTTHITNAEPNLFNSIVALGPYLGDVHISGKNRRAPSKDPCDFETIFKALKHIGYDKSFLIQYRLEEELSTIWDELHYVEDLIRTYLI